MFMYETVPAVPNMVSPPVVGPATSLSRPLSTASLNAPGLAMVRPLEPSTATALSFFAPMTAPTPERPAARPLSFITQAVRARFSPPGPMQATRASGCVASRTMFSVSSTIFPHRCFASRTSTVSSLT